MSASPLDNSHTVIAGMFGPQEIRGNVIMIQQLRSTDGTGTLSYILADPDVAVIIDPNIADVESIWSVIEKSGLRVTHIIDTHTHADHISAAGELRKMFGASVVMHENTKNKWKIVDQGDRFGIGDTLRANAAIPIDQYVNDGDSVTTGSLKIDVLFTPGHTDNHIALLVDGHIFTGDLLLIGQAGRSDLPGGDPGQQYDSLFGKIVPLPDTTRMHPGHDYANKQFAYLGDERRTNPFLQQRSKAEYIFFVNEFFPPIADAINGGAKMTLQCGVQRVAQSSDTTQNINPRQLSELLSAESKPLLLDVREPSELTLFGAIEGVQNIPVGQLKQRIRELPADKATVLVCVCQSGGRSFEAAHFLRKQGYTNVLNLESGTSGWVKSGYQVVRPVKP